MKIVLITHLKTFGGMRSFNFGKMLVQMGHDVTHVSISHRSRFRMLTSVQEGMQIIATPDLWGGRLRSGWDPWGVIRRLIHFSAWRGGKIDIVHGFECRPVTIYPILALKKKQIDLVFISDWNDWWG